MSDSKSPNPRNAFILDSIPDDDIDIQELKKLEKIKLAIKLKKKTLKQKNFDAKHPEIANLRKRMDREEAEKQKQQEAEAEKQKQQEEVKEAEAEKVKEPEPVEEVPKTDETKFNESIKVDESKRIPAPSNLIRASPDGSWF